MGPLRSRLALAGLCAAVALAWVSCDDGPFGPRRHRRVPVSLQPWFESPRGDVMQDPGSRVNRLRVKFTRANQTVATDTTLVWPADQDTLRDSVTVELTGEQETFTYELVGLEGNTPLFRTQDTLTVRGPAADTGAIVLRVPLTYVGPGVDAASVTIAPALTSAVAADTVRLGALVKDAGGGILSDVPIVWETEDSAAATVDTDGLVTVGRAVDRTATIVARVAFKDISAEATFAVRPASIELTPAADTAESVGDTLRLTAVALGADDRSVTGATYQWASLDAGVVALVQDAGETVQVVSRGAGSGRVTVTAGGLSDTATIQVTQVVTSVSVSPAADTATVGASFTLTGTAKDARNSEVAGATFTWASSDANVVKVTVADASGNAAAGSTVTVQAAGVGTAKVSATSGGKKGEATITVTPVPFPLAQVSVGDYHTCGLNAEGDAYCWGDNQAGQLGNNSTTNSLLPVAVAGGLKFKSISAGSLHTCAHLEGGAAYCWGDNRFGQLGIGTTTNSLVPAAVSGGIAFSVISAGGLHTCGVTTGKQAYCWGLNYFGQLGIGSADSTKFATPQRVAGAQAFELISAGGAHTCALTGQPGAAYCWGIGSEGELGTGDLGSQTCGVEPTRRSCDTAPVAVTGGRSYTAISAGGAHSCAVTDTAEPLCWGYNAYGQLGDNTTTNNSSPVQLSGPRLGVKSIDAGTIHTCVVTLTVGTETTGTTAYCWGRNNSGQLGDGSIADRRAPVAVPAVQFQTVATGGAHSCGTDLNSQALCWGQNEKGQLGNGTTIRSLTPALVAKP